MDGCQIRVVRSKDPLYGHSLLLYLCPGIESLGGLVKVSSVFRGGVSVSNMNALVTLDALRHVRSVGDSGDGTSINLQSNPNLQSVEALKGCCMDYRSKRLWVEDNPRLMCVPFSWPKKDKFDNVSDSQTAPTVQSHSISRLFHGDTRSFRARSARARARAPPSRQQACPPSPQPTTSAAPPIPRSGSQMSIATDDMLRRLRNSLPASGERVCHQCMQS